MAADNRELGRFILDGIPPAPRGVPQIEVTFDIDANGILSVTASDKATGKDQSIRIEGSGGLESDEIDRMVKDAESHASEDSSRRETIEKHNQLDSVIYQAEKMISENEEKIGEEGKQSLESAIEEAKKDLESDDLARLDSGRQSLEAALHQVAEALYKAEAPPAGEGPAGEEAAADSNDDEDVIDAEYTEEKTDS